MDPAYRLLLSPGARRGPGEDAQQRRYRIRYRIDDEARQILVLDVQHRRDAYRS